MQLRANENAPTYTAGPLSLGNAVDRAGTVGQPLSRKFTATSGAFHFDCLFLGNGRVNGSILGSEFARRPSDDKSFFRYGNDRDS